MELINTIWNALTTPNEMLINIISFPMLVIELSISTLLFTTLLDIKSTIKQKIIYILILSSVGFFSSLFVPSPYYTFINIIACPILVYFIFKTNILKSILAEILPYILFVILASLILNICVNISGVPTDIFVTIPIAKLLSCLLSYGIAYILYKLCQHFKINIKIFTNLKKKNNLILTVNVLIGLLAITLQSYLISTYNNIIPIPTAILCIAVLLVYFIFSMYSLIRTNKLEITTQSLEEEKLYNKTLTILYDNIRGFRHNFNNIVQAIGGYISTNNMEGLKTYYTDVLNASQKVNNLSFLNPELINNPAVYSILTSKYYEADQNNIKMNFEILLDLNALNIKTYDLTIILGILLDNAIDACKKCDEKEINVSIRKDNKANRQLFIIENTYSNKDVDTDRIFEKGYTSKQDEDNQSHGLGLWNVREIIKKNNNLNLFTTKNKKLFKQQLEIYC